MTCFEISFRALSFGGAGDEEDPDEAESRHGKVVESERLNDRDRVSSGLRWCPSGSYSRCIQRVEKCF